jgi:chromosome segregation and condensation protein ScpB
MRQITITLPDSVELSEQEIQALVLEKAAGKSSAPASSAELATLLGRPVSPEELADLRHLIGLYYAERAADLVDSQWAVNGWTAETMHEWLREHLRTSHGRPSA